MTIALLSWRVVAEIALSENQDWLAMIVAGQKAGRMLVAQYSLIKASGFVRQEKANDFNFFDRFMRQCILLPAIVDPLTVSGDLYNQLAKRSGAESLELFAACLAIQNNYIYVCWDETDLKYFLSLDARLTAVRFEALVDGF